MNNWSNSWSNVPKAGETWDASKNPPINPEPSIFPEWDSKDRDAVIVEWNRRKKALEQAKAAEMDFRKYVVKRAFPSVSEGTNTLDLGNGYALKAGIKYNYKLADNDTVKKGLDQLSKIGNQGSFITDRLVSWTPNFLLTEYRNIQEEANKGSLEAKEMLKIITGFLTIDEAAPSLELKEPKVKK